MLDLVKFRNFVYHNPISLMGSGDVGEGAAFVHRDLVALRDAGTTGRGEESGAARPGLGRSAARGDNTRVGWAVGGEDARGDVVAGELAESGPGWAPVSGMAERRNCGEQFAGGAWAEARGAARRWVDEHKGADAGDARIVVRRGRRRPSV